MPSFDPIIALQRGLEVLAVVNKGKHVSVKMIYEQTGLHKATVIRMLETLMASGYVAKTARSTYVPTGRTLLLSNGYDLVTRVSEIAGPVLAEFRRASPGRPTSLSTVLNRSAAPTKLPDSTICRKTFMLSRVSIVEIAYTRV
jgi:DNA-binding IclR family transcriptional regulator